MTTEIVSHLSHDVDAKKAQRDRLQRDYESWVAKHGAPVLSPVTVRADQKQSISDGRRREGFDATE